MNSETNCVFCRIDKSEIEAQFLHTDEFCFAINDINPISPVHLLVIPKFHYRNFKEILDDDPKLVSHLFSLSDQLSKAQRVDQTGFRLVINQGDDAGQEIEHFHMHLLGGQQLDFPSA